jgi:preprotein translocase subunit YajC
MAEKSKIEYNKAMIGKVVSVTTNGGWRGQIVAVKDAETFQIQRGPDDLVDVSIWDVRALDQHDFSISPRDIIGG